MSRPKRTQRAVSTEGDSIVRPKDSLDQGLESRWRVEGEMTIYRATALKAELLAALQPNVDLAVDLSAVTELDTAGLQLLLLAHRTAKMRNGHVRFVALSSAVIEVIELLRLQAELGSVPDLSLRGEQVP
ncbi:MAG TPA: STAS domain-containing protein [Polyangiaceae bacterium]